MDCVQSDISNFRCSGLFPTGMERLRTPRVVTRYETSKQESKNDMSTKILLTCVATALIGTTALASAQTRRDWQEPYAYPRNVAPGPTYEQGPFVGTFSEGLPYGMNTFEPGAYPYGPPPAVPAPMER